MKYLRCVAGVAVLLVLSCPALGETVFELASGAATFPLDQAFVAGSFNDWSTTATPMALEGGTWRARVALPDGRHYYKFVCRDVAGSVRWLTDPRNDCMADDGHGGANSIVDVGSGAYGRDLPPLEYFEVTAPPKTKWVNVAGDFNDWRQGQFNMLKVERTKWRAFIEASRPLTFKYIIDGMWQARPERSIDILMPDGVGGLNCLRKPLVWPVPVEQTSGQVVTPGDSRALEAAESLARKREFGKAVGLARKIVEVNGAGSPIGLRALEMEADLHKRTGAIWLARDCWTRLVALDIDSTPALHAAAELAAYHTYQTRRYDEARALAMQRLERAKNPIESMKAAAQVAEALRWGKRREEAVAFLDANIQKFPPPTIGSIEYASAYSDLWLIKAHTLYELGKRDEARLAYENVIRSSLWPDSQPALLATMRLRGMNEKDKQP